MKVKEFFSSFLEPSTILLFGSLLIAAIFLLVPFVGAAEPADMRLIAGYLRTQQPEVYVENPFLLPIYGSQDRFKIKLKPDHNDFWWEWDEHIGYVHYYKDGPLIRFVLTVKHVERTASSLKTLVFWDFTDSNLDGILDEWSRQFRVEPEGSAGEYIYPKFPEGFVNEDWAAPEKEVAQAIFDRAVAEWVAHVREQWPECGEAKEGEKVVTAPAADAGQYKTVTFYSAKDRSDFIEFKIPADMIDFTTEYEKTCLCMPLDEYAVRCIWHDGDAKEKTPEGLPLGAHWYYAIDMWFGGYELSSNIPFGIVVNDWPTYEKDEFYLYDENKNPQKVSEYKYTMFVYDYHGYPRITEEEFNKKKEEYKKEMEKTIHKKFNGDEQEV